MAFIWAAGLDGSSFDLNKVEAFNLVQGQKHNDKGEPQFEDNSENPEVPAKPIMQLYVVAVIGANTYPIRPVKDMADAQLTVQSILGNLKKEYDKEHRGIEIATGEEKKALKIA